MLALLRRTSTLVVLAATALAIDGCHKCSKLNDPSCKDDRSLTQTVFLFGYNVTETDVLMHRVRSNSGLIPVAYTPSEGRLTIVNGCTVSGAYGYEGGGPKDFNLEMKSEDEAKGMLPLSWASFSAGFKQSQSLVIHYRQPGTFWAPEGGGFVLDGDGCKGATHVISGIAVGAYQTHIGSASGVVLGASAPGGVGGGASSNESSDQRVTAGAIDACDQASASSIPDQCAEPIMLTLTKIGDLHASTDSCNDSKYMSTGGGYSHNTSTNMFVITADELTIAKGDVQHGDFVCKAELDPQENKALDAMISFMDEHKGVKVHISVAAASINLGTWVGCSQWQHKDAVAAKLGALIAERRVSIDSCVAPTTAGVYIELVSGCVEGASPNRICAAN